jgi:glycosyltransferase involved in cell wall biosynthesis
MENQQQENQVLSQTPNQQENQVQNPQQKSESEPKKEATEAKNNSFRIGVIVNGCNYRDIKHYNEQFRKINKMYKDRITFVFFGYRPEDDFIDSLEGVNFEYVKPVSIVHYFKQLHSLNIHLLLIPLIKDTFNTTSENYNKYLEASALRIPVIAPDVYPYNKIIKDKINGFIFGDREHFIPYLKDLLGTQLGLVRLCANHANKDVLENFNYSEKNMQIISNIFDMDDDSDEEGEFEDETQTEEGNEGNDEDDNVEPTFEEQQ